MLEQLWSSIAAEADNLFSARDRSYERKLLKELERMVAEAEFLFGARNRSYRLLEPLIYEKDYAQTRIYPFSFIRIYLTDDCRKDRYSAAYELAHEAVHTLDPPTELSGATILEEGLATYFAHRYMKRVYGVDIQSSGADYEAARRAVSPLLAKNEFVIKELRARQSVISKIDERLLVKVAGIDLHHARFLCKDFQSWGRKSNSWSTLAEDGAQRLVNCVRSIWD